MEIFTRVSSQLPTTTLPLKEPQMSDRVVLGKKYPLEAPATPAHESSSTSFFTSLFSRNTIRDPNYVDNITSGDPFLKDVVTRLHFTYRTRFKPIMKSPEGPSPLNFSLVIRENPIDVIENAITNPDCFNTDIGWGCMIRTGQSLLGNTLQIVRLGRDFRYDPENKDISENRIIEWFIDAPEKPFSLHQFITEGMELSGKNPGEWFGPAATARSIQSLIRKFPDCGIAECLVSVSSGDIYSDEVKQVFADNKKNLLILLGVKLGLNAVNECYWDSIRHILSSKYSVGISGGRPSSSLYFFGYEGDELLYFDPHSPQPSLEENNVSYKSCHTNKYGKLLMNDMDPSMLLGFLIRGQEDWENFKEEVETSKIVNVFEERPCDLNIDMNIENNDFDVTSMDSQDSVNKSINNDSGGDTAATSIERNDYVDVGSILQRWGNVCNVSSRDEQLQDIKCKKQKIVVMGNATYLTSHTALIDFEVERVLVEQDTISIANPPVG
ncbi:hypothetical protein NCAS_0G01390 [Naumovozyma castellii]|uniref:Cysteine protease n=1 Tax=Naumovozyma castellii TaxID=27288 RepID=G0VHZ2_NAUCA|nr:hypothetical protein NCAS_0G01390 [Naumovozyma castellii CBS 4309]CCC71026.1 hypothetical protein NCAS_0G01390 [Naumovozyma castellii CBS 4309]